jgi:hypothetical protein
MLPHISVFAGSGVQVFCMQPAHEGTVFWQAPVPHVIEVLGLTF